MAANPWRGEVEITLGCKHYILRPTFSALSNIEQELDMGLIALATKFSGGNITLEELAVIITQCITETTPDIDNHLIQGELANTVQGIGQMFASIFGGYDAIK